MLFTKDWNKIKQNGIVRHFLTIWFDVIECHVCESPKIFLGTLLG